VCDVGVASRESRVASRECGVVRACGVVGWLRVPTVVAITRRKKRVNRNCSFSKTTGNVESRTKILK
jgi:hypothetical protein